MKNRLHRAVSLRQHGFFVQTTKQQINLLTGYFTSGIADLGIAALGYTGPESHSQRRSAASEFVRDIWRYTNVF